MREIAILGIPPDRLLSGRPTAGKNADTAYSRLRKTPDSKKKRLHIRNFIFVRTTYYVVAVWGAVSGEEGEERSAPNS